MTAQPEGRGTERRWIIAAFPLVVAGMLAAIWLASPKRPTYEGKTAEEWLFLCNPTLRTEDDPAWTALTRMGAAALPDLERILSRRPNKRHGRWREWMIRLHLTKPDPFNVVAHELNYRAARAAYILAENGDVDIRVLLHQLIFHFTNSTYGEFSRALARAGDEGFSVLTNHVMSDQPRLRDEAASALRFLRNKPQAIAVLLRVATLETNLILRANALGYLKGSGAPADKVVPLAMESLRSEDGYTRWQAADLLLDYRSIAEVSKALQTATNDPDPLVRQVAARSANR